MTQNISQKHKKKGVSTMEYGIIASLVAVAAILSIENFGTQLKTAYCNVTNKVFDSYACGKYTYDKNGVEKGVDYQFVDSTQNGNDNLAETIPLGSAGISQNGVVGDELASLNKIDPITHIYGLYNNSGTTISDYSKFLNFDGSKYPNSGNNSGTTMWTSGGWGWASSDPKTMFQVVGASGTVYNVTTSNTTGQAAQDNNYSISISNAENQNSIIQSQIDNGDYYCCNGNIQSP